jgi:phosphate/phosphite/phosphonate ABC transporter binding protein
MSSNLIGPLLGYWDRTAKNKLDNTSDNVDELSTTLRCRIKGIKMTRTSSFSPFFLLFFIVFGLCGENNAAAQETTTINIGVLARRGSEACLQEWSPTAQYLAERIPGSSIQIIPLTFQEISSAVENARVDFVITNPYIYVELQNLYGVSRMATMKRLTPQGYTPLFGGIIFCRADHWKITSIEDLKGKSFAAVDETSFGGWMVAWRELNRVGIDPVRDFAALTFTGTHDDVILSVREGRADAGTVATPILEQMIAEGKITPDTFRVLNKEVKSGFPYALSTRLYPEWPFARLKHTPDELAEKVAIILLGMPMQSSAAQAAGSAGWTVPFDYASVEACMRELRVGIYTGYGKVTLSLLFTEYRWQVLSVIATLVVLTCLLIHFRQLNQRLRRSESTLLIESQERRQANVFLQQSRQQLADIIDFLPDATLAIDREGRIIIWNKAIEKMTGIAALEMIGKGDYAYTVPFYGEARKQLMDLILGEHKDVELHYPSVTREGNTLTTEVFCKALYNNQGAWIFAKAAPLHDQSGNVIGAIESIRDISERKQAEEEQKKLQAQLHQSQKMESIGTLAGGIAHDFNNILGIVIGYAEMAQDDAPAKSVLASNLRQILNAGHRAKELVKQILDFSRQAETERIPIKPATIIKEAIKLLRSSLPMTIGIQQDIDADAGPILADPTQIHQILMNLCTNAFHAMEATGGTLNISLKNSTLSKEDLLSELYVQAGDFVQLSIGDTGTGIPLAIRDRMFDPFFTTKEVGKGTGMGLAIIHGIVKNSGGFISCHSQPGAGTVFDVYLPVISDTDPPQNLTEDPLQLGNERILFIDDEEMLLAMGTRMLELLGYRVTAEKNSIDALALFENRPNDFDLIITDQTMPGMTGGDLALRILQIRPNIPIILCTGYSNLISEDRAKAMGIKGFAMKPLAKKDIAALIREVLNGKLE